MSVSSVFVLQGNTPQKNVPGSVLRSGTIVSGRVIAKNADGSYSVSLAGQKINVKSESPLQTGGIFSARVSIKGGSVELSLIKENLSPEILQKFGGSSEISPQVANLLSSLGFEADSESYKILQFMQQIGIKFDVDSAKKALRQAKKSSDNEEKAQISFLLEEKGIKSTDERVQAVMGRNHQNENRKEQEKSENRAGESGKEKRKIEEWNSGLVKSYFSQVDDASSSHDYGLLTAFNTVLASSKKDVPLRHWIILPFEWDFRAYTGNIRFLFDSELKNLEKIIVNIENPEKKHIFVLEYKGTELCSVKFASDSEFSDFQKSRLCEVLSSMFNKKISVEVKDFASLKGFCAEDEQFSFLDGRA
jgi:hypothetical protein